MRRCIGTLAALAALTAFVGCSDADVEDSAVDAEGAVEQTEMDGAGAAESATDADEDAFRTAGRDVTAPGWDWAEETEGQITEVPFPIYPGATLVSYTMDMEEGELQGLGLRSEDPMADVLAFYQDEAGDMRHMEQYNTHFFWRGAEEFDPFDIERPVPNIQLGEGIDDGGTTITFFFTPTGG